MKAAGRKLAEIRKLQEQLGGGACALDASCFVAGTLVMTCQYGLLRIESVQIAILVLTYLPEERKQFGLSEPEPFDRTDLRVIRLVLWRGVGDRVDIELMRPAAWVEESGATIGGVLCLNMPKMGVRGEAEVLAIDAAPRIFSGAGRLVTGTFRHSSGEVYDLKLAAESKPIGVTATHPFWSCDRHAWVPAADLQIGEAVKMLTGTTIVETMTKRPDREPVYNIEVEGDHVYRVGVSGVLVHNASATDCQEHTRTLETRPAPAGTGVDQVFQRRACGQTEYRVVGGGERAWADSIEGCDIVDCKAVRNRRSSPALGTAPDFIQQSFRTQELALFRRYEAVINDPCTPYDKLIVVVDRADVRPFWQSLLNQLSITSSVEIRSADLNS